MFAELLLITLAFEAPHSSFQDPSLDQALATFGQRFAFPVAALEPVARRLWIVWHEERDWAMAFYTAPETPSSSWLDLGLEPVAVKPGLSVPRLFLHAPHYRREGSLKPLGELAVDETEYLFHALIEAYFDLKVHRGESLRRRMLERRAEDRLSTLPSSVDASAVYTASLVDFAAHVMAVANEIQRSFRRRGEGLCALLDHPSTLFGLWAKIFADGGYRSGYALPDGDDASASRWALSPYELSQDDKQWLISEILGGSWTGNIRQDLATYCPSEDKASQ